MLAATFAEYGPPEKLSVGEIPRPTPGAGELLVQVAAAGLNPIDCRIRSGELRHFLRVGLPFVSGSDIAGIVEAAGPGANRFHAGDAVFCGFGVEGSDGLQCSSRLPAVVMMGISRIQSCFSHQGRFLEYHSMVLSSPASNT